MGFNSAFKGLTALLFAQIIYRRWEVN